MHGKFLRRVEDTTDGQKRWLGLTKKDLKPEMPAQSFAT